MRRFSGTLLGLLVAISGLSAQAVYTELTDPEQIGVFTAVSESLTCGCGCHLVLSTCPHVDCPWAIPVRRIIENRIRAGQTNDQILSGITDGFGEGIRSDPTVQRLAAEGREDFVNKLVHGFGRGVLAKNTGFSTGLVLVLFLVGALISFFVWRRRARTALVAATVRSPEVQAILDKTKDLDR